MSATEAFAFAVDAEPNVHWRLHNGTATILAGIGALQSNVTLGSGYHDLRIDVTNGASTDLGTFTVRGVRPTWSAQRDSLTQLGPGNALGGICSTAFLFTVDDLRYFLATAGHCFANTSAANQDGNLCDSKSGYQPLGHEVEVTGATKPLKLAYGSYYQMRINVPPDPKKDGIVGKFPDECFYNDFALIEVDPADYAHMHPGLPVYGGPTKLGRDQALGDMAYGFGSSWMRGNFPGTNPAPDDVDHFRGPFHEYVNGTENWRFNIVLFPDTMFGDSGMSLIGASGEATGTLTGIGIGHGPGQAVVTDLVRAVDYAQPWFNGRLELVTWDTFTPTLV